MGLENDVIKFLETKRTYRKFKQDPIPGDVLRTILTAGQLYSSGGNRQGIKYVVVNKPEDVMVVNNFVKWAAYLPPEQGTPGPSEIPVMFIALVQDTTVGPASDTEAGLALGNLQGAAWACGVGSCIMGAIDRPKLMSYLKIPEDMVLHSMIAFGYPLKDARPVEFNGDLKYYLDDGGNTCVPKRPIDEIYRFL